MGSREFDRVRKLALSLPKVNERLSHGEPCFFIEDKRPLCYFHDDHNGDGRISLWCPAPEGMQEALVAEDPDRFFAPPTSARGVFSGWLGIYLDTSEVDWTEVAEILKDSYRFTAPKRLVADISAHPSQNRRRGVTNR
jgi:hypothetical protein